jgi:Transposase
MTEILCGIDWASDHHDVALIDPEGTKLGRRRISDDAAGLASWCRCSPRTAAARAR